MPKNILRFERLMYASLAVALVDLMPSSTTLIASSFREILLGFRCQYRTARALMRTSH